MRNAAAAAAGIALMLMLSASAQAAPAVSVHVFQTSAPTLTEDSSGFAGTWQFGWKVVAQVRGAAACDKWTVTGSGPGGSAVQFTGGAQQEASFTGTVQPAPQFARLNATARCTIGTTNIDGTAEEGFVYGPQQPDRNAEPTAPERFLSQSTETSLRRAAGALTGTAILTCRAAAMPKRVKNAKKLVPVLEPLCAMSLVSAFNASLPNSGDGDSYSIAQPELSRAIPGSQIKAICKPLRGKNKRKCTALRKSLTAYLGAVRQSNALSGALLQSSLGFRVSGAQPSDQLVQAAAGRTYAGLLADSYVTQLSAARDLLKRLKSARLTLKLSTKDARRAGRDFERGTGIPQSARFVLGANPSAVAGLLLQLRETAGGGKLDLSRVLVPRLPTDALRAESAQITWPMFVALVQRAASGSSDESDNSPGRQIERHVDKLGVLCNPDARVGEEQAIALLAGQIKPYGALLARAAAPIAANPPRDLPAGCTPPKPPAQGTFLGIGGFGTGPGQMDRPTDVAIGPGGIYVADQGNSRVDRFAADGTFIGSWGSRPDGDNPPADGQFIEPVGVATDASGNVYVTDFRADRVQKFTADGQFLAKWGQTGTGDGQFTRVGGVAVGPSGAVYVVDPGGERIQRFDSNGNFQLKFGTNGSGPGQFQAPRGITVAPNGEVYVAERDNGRVQVYDSNGTFLREWGHRGLEEAAFNGCYDVAIDPSGNVWVADLFGYRIEKFTPTGDYLGLVEEWGPNRESFNPFAVAVDANYNVWVTDITGGTGDRVLMFGNLR